MLFLEFLIFYSVVNRHRDNLLRFFALTSIVLFSALTKIFDKWQNLIADFCY